MKKTFILLLLLLATLAVARRYWFPPSFPTSTPLHVVTKRSPDISSVGQNTVDIRYTAIPNYPLADIEEAAYDDSLDVVGSALYKIVPGSSLDRARTDDNKRYVGEVDVKEGKAAIRGGAILAGAFVIDMKTIRLKGGDPKILEEVISTSNLDIDVFSEASFILQESKDDTVTGILTIKGISKKITFPALVLVDDKKLRLFADFSIDRSHWGIGDASATLSPYIDLSIERILQK